MILFLIESFCDSDGASWTNESAQMTSDAFLSIDVRFAGHMVKCHCLMSAIAAREVATSAADAYLAVHIGICHGFAIEI